MTPDTPFDPAHTSRFFVETTGVVEALERLNRGLGAREPFLLVTGSSGTGKTALAHEAIVRWGARVAAVFLAYPALDGTELLEEILRRLGAEPPEGTSRPRLMSLLERTIGEITTPGQVAVIVVDDADRLSAETLEELRLLVNVAQQAQRLIEVVLIGLPVLEARLDEPAFAGLRQRVAARVRLEALTPADTDHYVQQRVTMTGMDGPAMFPRKTCREIAALSKGVPRKINALAAEAMNRATESGARSVTPANVQMAASALWGITPPPAVEQPPVAEQPVAAPRPVVAREPVAPAPPAVLKEPVASAPPAERKPVTAAPPVAPPKQATPPIAPPKQTVPPKPIVREPTPAKAVTSEPAAVAAPPRAKPTPAEAPKPAPPEEVEATHEPVTHHDTNEWVSRFVGEKGPVQIGSRSEEVRTWDLDYLDGPTEPPAPEDEQSAPPSKPGKRSKPQASRLRAPAPRGMGGITTVAASSVAIIAVVALLIRAGGSANGRAAQAKAVSAQAQAAPGRADSVKAAPAAEAHKPRATAESSAPAASSRTKRPFTLEVGAYDTFDTAYDERDRMQSLTGIEGWVISPEQDGEKYRVVLGAYRSEKRATGAANMLVRSRTLRRVTVVSLPPKEFRN